MIRTTNEDTGLAEHVRPADRKFLAALEALYGPGGSARVKPPPKPVEAVPCSTAYASYKAAQYEKKLARINAASARRHAAKLRRTPPWADQAAIQAAYAEAAAKSRETGIEHHVDHFYPLQGAKVSGLHVHTNLRVIPGVENMRKNNRYEPE